MIVLVFGLLGAVLGVLTARRRGGNRLDMAQYGAGFGIAFAVTGLFVVTLLASAG